MWVYVHVIRKYIRMYSTHTYIRTYVYHVYTYLYTDIMYVHLYYVRMYYDFDFYNTCILTYLKVRLLQVWTCGMHLVWIQP